MTSDTSSKAGWYHEMWRKLRLPLAILASCAILVEVTLTSVASPESSEATTDALPGTFIPPPPPHHAHKHFDAPMSFSGAASPRRKAFSQMDEEADFEDMAASSPQMGMEKSMPGSADVGRSGRSEVVPAARMLVKHGSLTLQTPRTKRMVEDVVSTVSAAVDAAGGYIERKSQHTEFSGGFAGHVENSAGDEESERSSNGERLVVSIEARVPVKMFTSLHDAFKRLNGSIVRHESMDIEDITSRYVDAAARAASLEGTHDQLLKIMKNATQVSDVLKVQSQLQRVRQDLEVQKQQKLWLQKEAAMSRLSVLLREAPPDVQKPEEKAKLGPLGAALKEGTRLWGVILHRLVFGGMLALVLALPPLVLGLLCMFVAKRCCGWSLHPGQAK